MRVGDMQAALQSERDALRGQRESLDKLQAETAQVVGQAAWTRLQQVVSDHKELLVHAEAGVAEVAWAQRQKSSDELSQIQADQARELRMLDDAFALPEDNRPCRKARAVAAAKPTESDGPECPGNACLGDACPWRKRSGLSSQKNEEIPLPADLPVELQADYRRYFEAARSYKHTLDEVGRDGYKVRRSHLKNEFAARLLREEACESSFAAKPSSSWKTSSAVIRSIRVTRPMRCSVSPSFCLNGPARRLSAVQIAERRNWWRCPTTPVGRSVSAAFARLPAVSQQPSCDVFARLLPR